MKRQLIMGVLVAAMGLGVAQAANESIYGARLMTEQERATYQNTIRTMTTEQARATYRADHQAQIQARAREQGVTLNGAGDPVGKDGKLLGDRDQDRLHDQDRDQTRDRDTLHDGSGVGGTGGGVSGGAAGGGMGGGSGGGGGGGGGGH